MNLRTQLLLALVFLILLVLGGTYALLLAGTRRGLVREAEQRAEELTDLLFVSGQFVGRAQTITEFSVGQQMTAQATLAAHLVDVAENGAGMSPRQIRERLEDVTRRTVLGRIRVTDETGRVYLYGGEEGGGGAPPQPPPEFRRLLEDREGSVVQPGHFKRDADEGYRYAAVSGVDKPRIVQVSSEVDFLANVVDALSVDRFAARVVDASDVLAAQLITADGKVISDYPGRAPGGREEHVPTARFVGEVRKALETDETVTVMEEDRLTIVRPALFVAEPGALVVAFDARRMNRAVRRTFLYLTAVAGGVLVLGVLTALKISSGIAAPLHRLAEQAEEIGKGNLDKRVDVHGGGEIGMLADAFNNMVVSLNAHIDQLRETTAARERLESELEIAADVQRAMLPEELPESPGLETAAFSRPARNVGGDFYDVVKLADGRMVFAVGDVSGKGLPAALLASESLNVVRTLAVEMPAAARILSRSNRIIYDTVQTRGLFVTMVCGVYDPRSERITLANAGHVPPLTKSADGNLAVMDDAGSVPLGMIPELEISEWTLDITSGGLCLLCTDGVTEARNPDGDLYGLERLKECLAEGPEPSAQEAVERIRASVARFVGTAEPSDDLTVMALRLVG
ncbi:MAG: PP2C family protein-serine/threonine phosphatase [Planctomycetota bacterium]